MSFGKAAVQHTGVRTTEVAAIVMLAMERAAISRSSRFHESQHHRVDG